MRFLPVSLDGILVEMRSLEDTLALFDQLQSAPPLGVEEIIPAARTLLIRYKPHVIDAQSVVNAIKSYQISGHCHAIGQVVEIPVRYNGEDLDDVAMLLGIDTAEVIARHTQTEFTVAFTGFAPGFAYLCGNHNLQVPRKASPRMRIPAGAVGLAGEFSGIYPKSSPGGWQLIGITEKPMWDLSRSVPALLQPGMRVHFYKENHRTVSLPASPVRSAQNAALGTPALKVITTGIEMLFQDEGRAGQSHQGISRAGALDRAAYHSANRAVGNPTDFPCIEFIPAGVTIESLTDTLIAVTGAHCDLTVTTASGDKHHLPGWQPIALTQGDRLSFSNARQGNRCYLALRDGFAVMPSIGSASYDTLAQLGPAPLTRGDILSRAKGKVLGAVSLVESAQAPLPVPGATTVLDVIMGPRTEWFTPDAVELFSRQPWLVTPNANRIGLRLQGDKPLIRQINQELPSEGTGPGAIQIPANGQPVLFLADHPLTGGYPVIAYVAPWHLNLAGQIPPGTWIQFNPVHPFHRVSADLSPASSRNL